MSTFAISGLASGIDTTSLISQLMAVAAQPQNALKNQLAAEQKVITAYQAINSKLTAFQAAADAVNKSATWGAAKATSSNSSIIATTTSGAVAGSSATFNVVQLAAAQVSTVAVPSGGTVVSTPANGIDVTDSAGTVHHLTLADGSASTVAAAVNGAGIGVRAAVVNTDSGQVLQFSAGSTGVKGAFSVAGLDTAPTTLVTAQDAKVAVGDPAAGGYTVSSSTNTFNNVLSGVTFTVGAVASNVTVSVSSDAGAISDKVKAMVDAGNTLLNELNADTAKGAMLEGNYQMNALTQSVLSTVSHGTASGGSFAGAGIQLTSTGTLKFDADAFAAGYTADPTGTQTAVSGLANSLSSLALNSSTQTLSPLINSGNAQVSNLNKEISDWDSRLATQQTALQAKYTAMEVALQKLNSTSSWLNQALSSMSGSSSSSSNSK